MTTLKERRRKQSTTRIQRMRCAVACALVAALFIALGVCERVEESAPPGGLLTGDGKNPAGAFLNAQDGLAAAREGASVSAPEAYALLERAETSLATWSSALPAAFDEEIGVLPDATDFRVYEGGRAKDGSASTGNGVVGYAVQGDVCSVMQSISDMMRVRGWSEVPLGGVEGATYVKTQGRFIWALITGTQVSSHVSVVVRFICGKEA